jgi:hypothetical protein
MYEVVWFYGEGCNDYNEQTFDNYDDANQLLEVNGYYYSTTYGTEEVYHTDTGLIASIIPA